MKSSVSLSLATMSAKICCTPVSMSWSAESPLGKRENKSKNYRSVFKSIIKSQQTHSSQNKNLKSTDLRQVSEQWLAPLSNKNKSPEAGIEGLRTPRNPAVGHAALEPALRSNPHPTADQMWDSGRVTWPLCASVSYRSRLIPTSWGIYKDYTCYGKYVLIESYPKTYFHSSTKILLGF